MTDIELSVGDSLPMAESLKYAASSSRVVDELRAKGISFSGIGTWIQTLMPIFVQMIPMCLAFLGSARKTASPKEFADKYFDGKHYDDDVVNGMARRIRTKSKRPHKLTIPQSKIVAVAMLNEARNS